LPAFKATGVWKLENLEAVSIGENGVSSTVLAEETANVRKDFPLQLTKLEKGANGAVRISGREGMDLRAVEALEGNHAEWLFTREGCPSCTKTILLSVKESAGKLIYVMESEDAESPFAYKFTFSPINN
jgi:hypothetical protein